MEGTSRDLKKIAGFSMFAKSKSSREFRGKWEMLWTLR